MAKCSKLTRNSRKSNAKGIKAAKPGITLKNKIKKLKKHIKKSSSRDLQAIKELDKLLKEV